mmetsp:Transcript_621/g.1665  ORF Transcript_621/g.1665 Transcript_621/m.1665 type:complete len:205 (+) Transcript_621:1275-1889(+)
MQRTAQRNPLLHSASQHSAHCLLLHGDAMLQAVMPVPLTLAPWLPGREHCTCVGVSSSSTLHIHPQLDQIDGCRHGRVVPARLRVLDLHRLDRRHRDGVHHVLHRAAARQVVHGLGQALHDGPHGDGARRLLHRLVRVVACVEVGEHKDGGPARHLTLALDLDRGHLGVDGGVVLDGALHLDVRALLLHKGHSLGHLVHVRPAA